MRLDHPLERSQEFPVFLFQANGYSNHATFDVTHDNALTQQRLKEGTSILSNIYINEICFARNRFKPESVQSLDHLLHSGIIRCPAQCHVLVVSESGECCALRQAIGIEGRTDSVQKIDDLRCGHTVPNSQSCKTIDF